jgi:hypothetical protein
MLPSAPETSLNSKCRKGRAYAEIVSSIFSPRPAGDAGRTEKGKPRRAQLRWSLVNMKKSGDLFSLRPQFSPSPRHHPSRL